MKRFLALICLVATCCTIGCSSTVDDAETTEATGSNVAAGASSLELGVAYWKVDALGNARGFDFEDERIAEFYLDADARTVRSLFPDVGSQAIDGSQGGLSQRSLALYEALIADVTAQVEGIEHLEPESIEGETEDKRIYRCYRYWNDCDVQGFYGILRGWWRGYICEISNNTRPYCGSWWALLY